LKLKKWLRGWKGGVSRSPANETLQDPTRASGEAPKKIKTDF